MSCGVSGVVIVPPVRSSVVPARLRRTTTAASAVVGPPAGGVGTLGVWGPGRNGRWPLRRVGSPTLPRIWWLGCWGGFSPACCFRSPGEEGAVGPVGCEYAPACAEC